jgi:hypothetical protein
MKKQRFESVVSGFSGSKNLLELLHIKNVDKVSFLCSLGVAWGERAGLAPAKNLN